MKMKLGEKVNKKKTNMKQIIWPVMRFKKNICKTCCLPAVLILLITLLLLPIVVNAQGGELATVSITSIPPFSTTLEIGQSVTFTAEGKDADGNTVPIPDPQWYSDGTHGTITVDPNNPNKCTYTVTTKGDGGYIQCCDGAAGSGVHGSRDFNVVKEGDSSNNNGGNDSPGFELLFVIVAIGFILYFSKKKNS